MSNHSAPRPSRGALIRGAQHCLLPVGAALAAPCQPRPRWVRSLLLMLAQSGREGERGRGRKIRASGSAGPQNHLTSCSRTRVTDSLAGFAADRPSPCQMPPPCSKCSALRGSRRCCASKIRCAPQSRTHAHTCKSSSRAGSQCCASSLCALTQTCLNAGQVGGVLPRRDGHDADRQA